MLLDTAARMTKSPTIRLLFGLLVTLGAVTGFSAYALRQVDGLRRLQANIIELNRTDSLRLLRVQNDLNMIDSTLREMVHHRERASTERFWGELETIRLDLNRALNEEAKLNLDPRRAGKRAELLERFARFWPDLDAVVQATRDGDQERAQRLTEALLIPTQAKLATQVSSMLERNNVIEAALDQRVSEIYNSAAQDIYVLLVVTIIAIAAISLYLIYSNRKLFGQLESYSHQRRILAARLISVQEEVLRSVSRELHDEFGQILTAVGAMLTRAEKRGLPIDSPFRTELSEVREITQETLEKIRSLSQMLHPAVIDDFGLEKAVEWYVGIFERQTGIRTDFSVTGEAMRITGQPAIHCFRIVQEALNNAAKHSGSKHAEVRLGFAEGLLTVAISDFGQGLAKGNERNGSGLGLIAMRERTELLNGKLEILSTPSTGTTVVIKMPIKREDLHEDLELPASERVLAEKS